MYNGLESLLDDKTSLDYIRTKKVSVLAHPASVDKNLNHILDIFSELNIKLSSAIGPQHGILGDKQDNMIESEHFVSPKYNIPFYSLYGKTRRLNSDMLNSFDVLVIDLQDVGCRIYTFITTLFYILEDCSGTDKSIWILDRPNPAGREIEGNLLDMDLSSFVGAAPIPMRHGLSMGELAKWYVKFKKLNVNLKIFQVSKSHYNKEGVCVWPPYSSWINPSPNLPTMTSTLIYPGSVILEGTELSEGRGTTRPLELIGANDFDFYKILKDLEIFNSEILTSVSARVCHFEPTFHKFKGQLCQGIQFHVDTKKFNYNKFKPYRLFLSLIKMAVLQKPNFNMWKSPPYEYEAKKLPFDLITGNKFLKEWVEDSASDYNDLDSFLNKDEILWQDAVNQFVT